MTENIENTEQDLDAAAAQAMNDLMADSTQLLKNYLRLTAQRLTAERELEAVAKEEWAAWRELTSPKKGGFSEAQLRRQAILPPRPQPRRDRGKKRPAKPSTKTTTHEAPATHNNEPVTSQYTETTNYGG